MTVNNELSGSHDGVNKDDGLLGYGCLWNVGLLLRDHIPESCQLPLLTDCRHTPPSNSKEQSPFWEAVDQPDNKSSFYGTGRFITAHTNAHRCSLSRATWVQSASSHSASLTLWSLMVNVCRATILTICNALFCIYGFRIVLTVNSSYFLHCVNYLIFVMVKCGVLFEVRNEFFDIT
jgi:hypothetical protein